MMTVRSILFTPGDSEKKIARGLETAADAVIFDLEDSVAAGRKEHARGVVRDQLKSLRQKKSKTKQSIWIRINALASGEARQDLAAIVAGAPDAIVLPKADNARDIEKLHNDLCALEARENLPAGAINIVAIATETPASIFGLGTYKLSTPRLIGLTWGAEDLSAAVGAFSNVDDNGNLTPLYLLARSLCLAAAAQAQILPIDAAHMNFKDLSDLRRECEAARRDGFRAKLAIHPDQVPVINNAFTPSGADVARAQEIVDAFENNPDAGVVRIGGAMIDRPHLKQAQHILDVNKRYNREDG